MKTGFTLIELLVVVLIIGVLAAIALPQYQRTVARTYAVEAVINLKALSEAQDRYYLANSLYTNDRSLLDIQVSDGQYVFNCFQTRSCDAYPKRADLPTFEFLLSKANGELGGRRWCRCVGAVMCRICGSLGGIFEGHYNSDATQYWKLN